MAFDAKVTRGGLHGDWQTFLSWVPHARQIGRCAHIAHPVHGVFLEVEHVTGTAVLVGWSELFVHLLRLVVLEVRLLILVVVGLALSAILPR